MRNKTRLFWFIVATIATGCGSGGGDASSQIVGRWHMRMTTGATEYVDVDHEFRSDGTVATTLGLHTACSGATPIPTTTTRTWSIEGNHLHVTVMSPDSCGVYPIINCLSDTGIACTDLPSETMVFAIDGGMLTLEQSAHGIENGTYARP